MVCSHIILIVSKVLEKKGRRMKRWDVLSKKKEIRATYRENKVTPYQQQTFKQRREVSDALNRIIHRHQIHEKRGEIQRQHALRSRAKKDGMKERGRMIRVYLHFCSFFLFLFKHRLGNQIQNIQCEYIFSFLLLSSKAYINMDLQLSDCESNCNRINHHMIRAIPRFLLSHRRLD